MTSTNTAVTSKATSDGCKMPGSRSATTSPDLRVKLARLGQFIGAIDASISLRYPKILSDVLYFT